MNKYIKYIFLFVGFSLFAQTKSERAEITKNYDQVELAKMVAEFDKMQTSQRAKALELAKINNWPITYKEDGVSFALIKVSENNTPIYYKTFNKSAARSTRANFLNTGGGLGLTLDGENMMAHVWDNGLALATHQELKDASGVTKIIEGDSGIDTGDHATHVTGTIIARGANSSAKGMAPLAKVKSFDWFGDLTEVTIEAANGMLISNHSYGSNLNDLPDWEIGAYTMNTRSWDRVMYQAPYYLMVCAAGNDGNDNSSNAEPLDGNSSYDKLDGHTVCKNNMVVANGFDLSVNSEGEIVGSINLDSSSSEGPTDDYRVKPDITGNGTSVFSCTDSHDTAYASWYGTSMASPNVAGSLLLLQELYNEENGNYMLSSTLRGLALHTADDGGMVGPDARFGWGYMNTKVAAESILNNGTTAVVKEMTLNEGESISFQVTSDGTNPLKTSICWTDKHSNNINTGPDANVFFDVLESDLDIRVTKGGTTHMPWKLTGVNTNTKGDNTVDNVERVDVDGASGVYTVTISHKDNLSEPQQAYALIITGITDNNIGIASNPITNFNIWPNPNSGIFNIFVEGEGNINLSISNILGKIIKKESYKNTESYTKTIDLTNLAKGIYLVSIEKEGKFATNKLIIE